MANPCPGVPLPARFSFTVVFEMIPKCITYLNYFHAQSHLSQSFFKKSHKLLNSAAYRVSLFYLLEDSMSERI